VYSISIGVGTCYLFGVCLVPYNRFAHITFYTHSKRLLLTIIHRSLYTKAASYLGGLQPRWPLVLRSLQLPHAFYTSMYLEVIAVLHYNNYNGDIHACVLKACISSKYSKCISAIKPILCTNRNVYILVFFRVFVFFSLLRCMFKP